jgi:hypothetical protein
MPNISPYSIAVEKQEVIVRFHKDMIDQDMLSKFLDYIVFESIRKRSQLTEQQSSDFADEVDRSVWDQIRHKFIEG